MAGQRGWGVVSGEQLLLQLFYQVGLEDAHQLFLRDGSCPKHFQVLLCFPESRKDRVDHFGCFLPNPPQDTMATSETIATGFLLVSIVAPFLTLQLPLDPVSCADMEMV